MGGDQLVVVLSGAVLAGMFHAIAAWGWATAMSERAERRRSDQRWADERAAMARITGGTRSAWTPDKAPGEKP